MSPKTTPMEATAVAKVFAEWVGGLAAVVDIAAEANRVMTAGSGGVTLRLSAGAPSQPASWTTWARDDRDGGLRRQCLAWGRPWISSGPRWVSRGRPVIPPGRAP